MDDLTEKELAIHYFHDRLSKFCSADKNRPNSFEIEMFEAGYKAGKSQFKTKGNSMKNKKTTKADIMKTIRVSKGEKLLLYFPDLEDYEELLNIKANASKVFGADNVLVVMGSMKVTKVQDL